MSLSGIRDSQRHRDAAGRPARDPHLRHPLRRGRHPRRDPARARARRAGVLRPQPRRDASTRMARRLRRARARGDASSSAHGQMARARAREGDARLHARRVDVLVRSAIIESGLDIPRANTIIVEPRRHLRPGAALPAPRPRRPLAPPRLRLPADSGRAPDHAPTRRSGCAVLQELDDLGGGFRLAAHDLEIRGAGNLLGKQQSGHIAAVGFELYTQMLEEAVRELRGEPVAPDDRARDPARHPGLHPRDLHPRREPAPRALQAAGRHPRRARPRGDRATSWRTASARFRRWSTRCCEVMELRRWLKDLRVTARASARRRDRPRVPRRRRRCTVESAARDGARQRRAACASTSGSALAMRPTATDHDGVIAEVRASALGRALAEPRNAVIAGPPP